MTTDLGSLGVAELLKGYEARSFTPAEVTDAVLARLDQPDLESVGVVTVVSDRARREAAASTKRWSSGQQRALDGVPFGAKDIIATANVRTSLGSLRWSDWVPRRDATCVARMRSAGAVLTAKLATPELAFGDAREGHRPLNPWASEHWTGGSSSGPAVALATRRLPLALGTDTGGSIRVPASYCGVTGFKPTVGLVPRDGVATVSWTLDHTGPMARSALDAALTLDVLSGIAERPLTGGCAGLRIGAPRQWFQDQVDDDVLAATSAAIDVLTDLGAVAVEVDVPDPDLAGIAAWVITVAEFAEVHADWRDHAGMYTTAAAERLLAGSTLPANDYLRAMRVRSDLRARCLRLFDDVDVLITPATPTAAPRVTPPRHNMFADGDRMWLERVARNLIIFNLIGLPAAVVPAGATDSARPLAVQLVGRLGEDREVLSAAAAFQIATSHHRMTPSLIHPAGVVA